MKFDSMMVVICLEPVSASLRIPYNGKRTCKMLPGLSPIFIGALMNTFLESLVVD